MMYIDNEVLEKMIMTIVEGFDRIEKKLDRMGRVKDFMNGDELLDNYDIASPNIINPFVKLYLLHIQKVVLVVPESFFPYFP